MSKMQLTLLGTATSQGIPVIGCECQTCQSNDPKDNRLRSSAAFSLNGQRVVIDTGPDFRQQMLRLPKQFLAGVLYTHEHNDHVAGLDDIRPYCFRQKMDIPMFALPRVADNLRERFSYAFSANPYPGVPRLDLNSIQAGEIIQLGGMEFQTIPVMHGKLPILGYRCQNIAYLTDVKTLGNDAKEMLKDLDVLVLSCLQFNEHHSHLSLEEALELIKELQAKRTVLTHLSHRFPPHSLLRQELPPNIELGYDGMIINHA